MLKKVQIERFDPENRREWRRWLKQNGSDSRGVWVVIYKKHSGEARLTYPEAVEEALCFGWIDSTPNKVDTKRYVQYFAPRRPRSIWSQLNKKRVQQLIREGRMAAPGLEKINAAKKDGSWRALDAIDQLIVPTDLAKSLTVNAEAKKNFEAFSVSSRKIILYWIHSARKPETRARRIEEVVSKAARNIRANHYRPAGVPITK